MGVSEVNKVEISEERALRARRRPLIFKKCLYDKTLECSPSTHNLEMCRNCPFGQIYFVSAAALDTFNRTAAEIFSLIVRRFNRNLVSMVYHKIVGLAISLAGQDQRLSPLLTHSQRSDNLIPVGKASYLTADSNGGRPTVVISSDKPAQSPAEL